LPAGGSCAVVESVKAASDVYCPIAGRVVAVNEHLNGAPQLVNQKPYSDGWLYRLELDNENDLDQLLTADEYGDLLSDQS
ncbi:MAG: glycine cleavage system protein H, partial [Gammaproteobacteria bacterium]|nr:glycine cleavage system protein H [Gammaproteobacteria bacterium]